MVYDQIANDIKKINNVLVITDSDLDGLTAGILIRIILEKLNKEYKITIREHKKLEGLEKTILQYYKDCSSVILLDSPYEDSELINTAKKYKERVFIYIDHHKRQIPKNIPENLKYYDIRALNLDVISTAEAVYKVGRLLFDTQFKKYSLIGMIGAIGDWMMKKDDILFKDFVETYKGIFIENSFPTAAFFVLYNIFLFASPKDLLEYGHLILENPLKFFEKINYKKIGNNLADFCKRLEKSKYIYEGKKFVLLKSKKKISDISSFISCFINKDITIFITPFDEGIFEKLFPKKYKISARRRRGGYDLGLLLREFTKEYGIQGGGHPAAAGGIIWKKDLNKFIEFLKKKLG